MRGASWRGLPISQYGLMRQVMRLLLVNDNDFLTQAEIIWATLPGFAAGRFALHCTVLRPAPPSFLRP